MVRIYILKKYFKSILGKHYFRIIFYLKFFKAKYKPPILIYQMGKVGSKTIELALKANGTPSIHVHVISKEGIARSELVKRSIINEDFEQFRNIYLRDIIRKHKSDYLWRIVTLVRDPIARNVSAFFENMDLWNAKLSDGHDDSSHYYLGNLYKYFFSSFDHERPLIWFDMELKENFNVDIFSEPFPKDQGYQIYRVDNIEILLLKLESINNCFDKAMAEFFGTNSISLVSTNLARNKLYNYFYKDFLHNLKFPEKYIENMYTSRYTLHFYSDEEISNFRKRWRIKEGHNIFNI